MPTSPESFYSTEASHTYSLQKYVGVRALVLGASGFIGRWVARNLCGLSDNVHLAVRNAALAKQSLAGYLVRGNIIELDLCSLQSVHGLFLDVRPSIAFNLVGYGVDPLERNERASYLLNEQLVQVLCESACEYQDPTWQGQSMVHIGSAQEYGVASGDLHEDTSPNPTTLYGQSKLAGTRQLSRFCQETGMRGVTARLFSVYGPGEHAGRLLPSLMETARSGVPLPLTAGNQERDFTYVEDVAEGLLRLGLSRAVPGEVVNLATGRLSTVRSFAEAAAATIGIPSEKLQFGVLPTRQEEMKHLPVSIARLRELTGWSPETGIRDGIARTLTFEPRKES